MGKSSQDPLPSGKRRLKGDIRLKSKLLVLAAVILFVWFFGKNIAGSAKQIGDSAGQQVASSSQDSAVSGQQEEANFLSGPLASLEQILFNSAQGAIDLSADDATENADLVFFQENSLVGVTSPNPSDGSAFNRFSKELKTYVVQLGDNPEIIGAKFGISADTILWTNNLKDGDLIHPGDKLIILPINGIRVKISAKDTISSLAKKYQGKADEIIAFNELPDSGVLKAGDYIIIPGGEPAATVSPKSSSPKVSAPKYASSTKKASSWLIFPTTGYDWGIIHSYNGVDVANTCGTPIYAAAAGRVILADASGWNGGYGKYIKIQHSNGVVTLYGHATQLLVSQGEQVAQGQLIAYMGTTGNSTGCHLHFEVRGASNPLAGGVRVVK
jgi:LysM repeat protein